ncbi:MAG: hypothetical protein DHS80DRAFT_28502 [Piptocephalis tieghemiana]|nr:MAG: hypothetical protein DHS80DRAFT_28502 [Piptocephalis tieghemiana]
MEDVKNSSELAAPDRPVRARKSIERFSDSQKPTAAQEISSQSGQSGIESVSQGSGTTLGEMEDVCFRLNKIISSDPTLKSIHNLMYGRPGKATVIKRNIRIWNGCAPGTEEKSKSRMLAKLDKTPLTTIKSLARIFGLELKGTKDEVTDRLITFLLLPSDSQRIHSSIPTSKKKKTKGSSTKSSVPKASKTPTSAPKKRTIESDDEEDMVNPKSKPKGKISKRETTPLASSDEDEPLGNLVSTPSSPKPTTDSIIISKIKTIIQDANLDVLTAKGVCKQLALSFPDLDVKARKSWLHQQIGLAVKTRSSDRAE